MLGHGCISGRATLYPPFGNAVRTRFCQALRAVGLEEIVLHYTQRRMRSASKGERHNVNGRKEIALCSRQYCVWLLRSSRNRYDDGFPRKNRLFAAVNQSAQRYQAPALRKHCIHINVVVSGVNNLSLRLANRHFVTPSNLRGCHPTPAMPRHLALSAPRLCGQPLNVLSREPIYLRFLPKTTKYVVPCISKSVVVAGFSNRHVTLEHVPRPLGFHQHLPARYRPSRTQNPPEPIEKTPSNSYASPQLSYLIFPSLQRR